MAEVRDEKTQWRRLDSDNGTHTNTSLNYRHVELGRRGGNICAAVVYFHFSSERKQGATNRKRTPDPLITFSRSHKHGRTTHNNFRSLWVKSATPHDVCGEKGGK